MIHIVRASLIDDALRIAHDQIFFFNAESNLKIGAGNGSRSRTVIDHLYFINLFLPNLQRIQQRCGGDDRRAVLIIVKHGNVH